MPKRLPRIDGIKIRPNIVSKFVFINGGPPSHAKQLINKMPGTAVRTPTKNLRSGRIVLLMIPPMKYMIDMM